MYLCLFLSLYIYSPHPFPPPPSFLYMYTLVNNIILPPGAYLFKHMRIYALLIMIINVYRKFLKLLENKFLFQNDVIRSHFCAG